MCLDCAPRLSLQTSYSSPQGTKLHTFWLCASRTTPLWMCPAKKIPTSWRISVQDLTWQWSTVAGWKENSKTIPFQSLCRANIAHPSMPFSVWWSVFCFHYQCNNQFNGHNMRSAGDLFQILFLKSPNFSFTFLLQVLLCLNLYFVFHYNWFKIVMIHSL